jgi:hypothetical protein
MDLQAVRSNPSFPLESTHKNNTLKRIMKVCGHVYMVFGRSVDCLTVEEGVVEETLKLFGIESPFLKGEKDKVFRNDSD